MSWLETNRNNIIEPGMGFYWIKILEDTRKRTKSGDKIFNCECICGKTFERSSDSIKQSLRENRIISCGCKHPMLTADIGGKFAYNEKRIEETIKSLGQISGTTMQGILRKKVNKNNNTGIRGVTLMKNGKYRVRLMICRKDVARSKLFDTLDEAAAYRKELERIFYKPFIDEFEAQHGHAYRDEKGKLIKEG